MMTKNSEVLANALYNPKEVADLLGLRRVDSVYAIPESELVPTWVGPRRGKKMFRGSDILSYLDRGRPAKRIRALG